MGTLLHTSERQVKNQKTILWEAVYPEIHKNLVDGYGYELSIIRDHLNNNQIALIDFDNRTVKRFLMNSFSDDIEFLTTANSKKVSRWYSWWVM